MGGTITNLRPIGGKITNLRPIGEAEKKDDQQPKPSLWEAANIPVGGPPGGKGDLEEKGRDIVTRLASSLPEPLRRPAAYAGNVVSSLATAGPEAGRRMMTPLGIMTAGVGSEFQALREVPGASTALKAGVGAVEAGMGALFGLGGAKEVVTPRQPGETGGQEFERRVSGAGQAILGGLPIVHALSPAIRISSQEIAGAGKERVLQANRSRNELISKQTKSYHEELAKARNEYKVATGASEEKGAAIDRAKQAAYENRVAKIKDSHQQKVQEVEADHSRKVAEIKAKAVEEGEQKISDWVKETMRVKGLQDQKARVDAQREVLTIAQEQYTKLAMDNAASTETSLRASLAERWNNFRDTVGKDTKLDGGKVYGAVVEAQQKFLKGSPSSIKVFNDLLKEMGIGQMMEVAEQEHLSKLSPQATEIFRNQMLDLDLDTARTHSSAIGDKRFSGDLPGNVYHALGFVQDAIESEIMKAATAKGMGAEYSRLKADWHQYMKDWNDMTSEATGGSPLARVKRAVDPEFVFDQVKGKASNRLIQTYAKYRKFGASPELLVKLRKAGFDLDNLPKVRVPELPERPVIKGAKIPEKPIVPAPEIPERPGVTLREIPKLRSVSEPKTPPPVDVVALRQKLLERYSGAPWGLSELAPWRFIDRLLMKSVAFREWVSRQPRAGESGLSPVPKVGK